MKVAIVTGASSGIGLGITRALLERDWAVVGTARDTKKSLTERKELALVDGDVGDPKTATRAVELAVARFGGVDLLVNNAGIFVPNAFTAYEESDFAKLVSTNLAGFFHFTRAALPAMKQGGHVVSISTSLVAQPIAGVDCALSLMTKGGIEAASRALSIEWAPRGVRFNVVAPGIVDTPMHPKQNHEFLSNLHPIKRIGTVDEIAEAVLYLDRASFVTGEVLHVDGGAHAGKW